VQTWGTESYIAAFAGPFIGLGCGYLLASGLRIKDRGIRHAAEITTGRPQHRPDATNDDLSLWLRPADHGIHHDPQTVGIVFVLLFVLAWRCASAKSGVDVATQEHVAERSGPHRLRPDNGEDE
jgi:bile acid:Na+ symporter, BASS family